ncbi:MAG: hypothetical protein IT365_23240 [Candidatus Hydrogenedentes bacterium]|nr:hypothetical protein [Candidatus Hydrogenedentota bacterium]
MKPFRVAIGAATVALVTLLAASCATTAKEAGPKDEASGSAQETATVAQDNKVTVTTPQGSLGDAVRAVGESAGGNLVLMGGLETRPIAALTFKSVSLNEVAATFAAKSGLAMQETPEYCFLFPAGYEPLVQVSLSGKLSPADAAHRTDVVFGSGLKLFTVFSWMSLALDRTIVADNAISESRCGELALKQVPLETALEAILKSARVVNFVVECTDEYILFRNPKNTNPESAMLNTEPLEQAQADALDRRVTVTLPHSADAKHPLEVQQDPVRLEEVIDSLSQQVGVPIIAEKGLEGLPVTPTVMANVRVRTALDLLIRQWLLPDYGYQVTPDRIVIRKR